MLKQISKENVFNELSINSKEWTLKNQLYIMMFLMPTNISLTLTLKNIDGPRCSFVCVKTGILQGQQSEVLAFFSRCESISE